MDYSYWNCPDGRVAVSRSKNQPGPVKGYLLKRADGWEIEGDKTGTRYQTAEEAAEVLLQS